MARSLVLIFLISFNWLRAFSQGDDKLVIVPCGSLQNFCLEKETFELCMELQVPANYCKISEFLMKWGDGKEETFKIEIPVSTVRQTKQVNHTYDVKSLFNSCKATEDLFVTVEATFEGSCELANRDAYPITFKNPPRPDFEIRTICKGQDLRLVNRSCPSTGLTYTWQDSRGNTLTGESPTVKYDTPGEYKVKLTAQNGCPPPRSIEKTIQVIEPAKAVIKDSGSVSVSNDTSLICFGFGGKVRLLGGESTNATSYQWSLRPSNIAYQERTDRNDENPLIKYPSTGLYAITLRVNNVCNIPDDTTIYHNVINVPVPTVNPPPEECKPIIFTLPDKNDGAQYFLNGNEVFTNTPIRVDTSDVANVLIARLTNECGTQEASGTFLISAVKNVSILEPDNITLCQGEQAVSLKTNRSDGKWDDLDLIEESNNTFFFNPKRVGAFPIIYRRGTGECQTKDSVTITVAGVNINVSDQTYCQSEERVVLDARPIGGLWRVNNSSCVNCLIGDTLSLENISNSVSLNFSFTDTLFGCKNNKDIIIKVSNPKANFSLDGGCGGEPLRTTNNSTGSSSYEWQLSSGGSSQQESPTFPVSGGNYTLSLTAKSGNCTDTKTENVSITDPPESVKITTDKIEGCPPLGVNLGVLQAQRTDLSYTWTIDNLDAINSYNPGIQEFENFGTDKREVVIKLRSFNQCGETFDELKLSVKPRVKASLAVDSTLLRCNPGKFLFSNSSIGANQNIQWKFGDDDFVTIPVDTISKKFTTNKDRESFDVILKVENDCDVDSDSLTVTVVPQQMIPLISIDKQEVCPGEVVIFSDASTPSATFFDWDFGDNDKSFVNNASHKFVNADTTYKVVYTARTECAIGKDSVYIKVSSIPTASFEVSDPVSCVNSPIIFSNTSTGDLISNTYWQYETNGSFDTTFNGLATYNSPGIRNITLFVEGKNSFCVNRANSTIEILDNPKPAFEVSRDSICLGSQIQLINLSQDATAFEWEFNNDKIIDFEPTYIPMDPGVYSIKLQAKQGTYCSDSLFDISAFTVLNCVVQVPEVFTPDGIPPGNEWNLVGDGIKEVQRLEIKNRYNKSVFITENSRANIFDNVQSWNGKYFNSGNEQPTGVYLVEYRVLMFDNSIKTGVSPIYLMR